MGKPVFYSLEPQILRPHTQSHAPQQKKTPQWEAHAQQLESKPHLLKIEENPSSDEDSAHLKINK